MDILIQSEGSLYCGFIEIRRYQEIVVSRVRAVQPVNVGDLIGRDGRICFQSGLQIERGQGLDALYLFESPFKKVCGVIVALVRSVIFQNSADQLHISFFGVSNEGVPGGHSVARLGPFCIFIIIVAVLPDDLGMVPQFQSIGQRIAFFQGVSICLRNLAELIVLHGGPQNERHVMGGGVMVFVRQSVRIGEMSTGTSKLGCSLIHQVSESLVRTGDVLRQRGPRLVGRDEHQGVQGIFHGELGAYIDAGAAAARFNPIDRFAGKCDDIIHGTVLHSQKGGHHLGDAGRILFGIRFFSVEDGAGGGVHHDGRLCGDVRGAFQLIDAVGSGITLCRVSVSGVCLRIAIASRIVGRIAIASRIVGRIATASRIISGRIVFCFIAGIGNFVCAVVLLFPVSRAGRIRLRVPGGLLHYRVVLKGKLGLRRKAEGKTER